MKKALFMVLVILAGTASTAIAKDKKDKKNQKVETVEQTVKEAPVKLLTSRDTTSYAAGYAATRGLIEYLQKNFELDTTFMADFKKGFYDAIANGNDPKYVAYNAGVQISAQVQKQILPQNASQFVDTPDSLDANIFYKGFIDGASADTTVFNDMTASTYVRDRQAYDSKIKSAPYIAENTKWLEDNKTKPGVVTLPSGLQYKVIIMGQGPIAQKSDNVTVKYEGKMIDGTEFDSSYKRTPDTTTFRPDQVIKGWTEALCLMPEGSVWELYIPQDLAYGERQAGKIKPFSTLIFKVEVVNVETAAEKAAKAATTVEPAKAAPATKTAPATKSVKTSSAKAKK